MTESTKPISALRQRMIEDMTLRKLSSGTQRGYVRAVKRFVHYFGRSPDMADAEDLRQFQLDLAKEGATSTNINQILTGLRFFYTVTLSRPEVLAKVSHVHEAEKLPVILSMEEVTRLLKAAANLKHKRRCRSPTGRACGPAKSSTCRVPTSTANVCLSALNRARGPGIAMPCFRRTCSRCCGPGGVKAAPGDSCCRAAGCSRAAIPSTRCRRANSTVRLPYGTPSRSHR